MSEQIVYGPELAQPLSDTRLAQIDSWHRALVALLPIIHPDWQQQKQELSIRAIGDLLGEVYRLRKLTGGGG